LRKLICGVMISVLPASLAAQGSDRALLHNNGGTWLNGILAPASSTVFPDDFLQTQAGSLALLGANGSQVTLFPETALQFEADELILDHGHLQLTTGRGMRVRVGCITIIPVTTDRTQYEVIGVDSKVKVIAVQRDVKIRHRAGKYDKSKEREVEMVVRESEQATREENCGAATPPTEIVAAKGAILNSLWAKGLGTAAIVAALCFGLVCHLTDDPVSPSLP
jgi:hypothetical protein